jgi:hypothetical protein
MILKELCWITYKAIDVLPQMYISKQLAKTPRKVEDVRVDNNHKVVDVIVDGGWGYLLDVNYDHPVDVLCDAKTRKPILDEVDL